MQYSTLKRLQPQLRVEQVKKTFGKNVKRVFSMARYPPLASLHLVSLCFFRPETRRIWLRRRP